MNKVIDQQSLKGDLRYNEPLARYTSWWIGGIAEKVYYPYDLNDLSSFLKTIPEDEPITWLGLGSNTLIRDGGLKGTVIITQGALKKIERLPNNVIRAEAGIACPKLARWCVREGYQGLEFLVGIPGTIGGALCMNAGAFGGETWEQVHSVEIIDRQGNIIIRTPDAFKIHYREVTMPYSNEWFVAGHFNIEKGQTTKSKEEIKTLLRKRSDTQPIGQHSCGSVFRNPEGDHAARLIECSGLKGYTIGKAQVSKKHANFIINLGDAKSSDIEQLIQHIQKEVYKKFNIRLQPEVHIIGREE